MAEQGSKGLAAEPADKELIYCRSAAGDNVQTSGSQVSDEIHPGGSTNTSTTITNSQNVVATGNLSAGRDITITQDVEVQNLLSRTTSNIQDRTRGMVRTSALKAVMDKLITGTKWVTITGQPGEGKSTTAFMALEELQQSGRQVFQVISPEEFTKVTATYPNGVVMLDDIFGALEFNHSEWSRWETALHQVLSQKEHRSHEKGEEHLKEKEGMVIFVGRDYVLKSVSSKMGGISDYFTSDEHVVYLTKAGERDIQEKLNIWNAISEASGIELDEETIDKVCKINVPHGFPHVCKLFVTMRQKDTKIDAEMFFKAPLEFLNQTVQIFMSDKVKLSLFKEMIKRNGSVNIRDLGNVDNSFDIIEAANNLVGSYLNNEDGNFTFNHPSIYDSVAFNICQTYPLFVIENCHLSFLHERLRLDSNSNESSRVVCITSVYLTDLAKRCAKEISMSNLVDVLSHPAVRDEQFVKEMMSYIWFPGYQLPRLTDINTGDSFLGLIASSKSHQLLKYLDNHRFIKLSKSQLNTVLYGVCKYAASDVLAYLVQTHDTLDINVRYEYDKTPLMIASETRDSQFVLQIMSLGPDLNARDSSSSQDLTVLHYLCKHGLATAVELLIEREGVVDVQSTVYGSPLRYACENNQVDVARVLIDRGARFDAKTVVDACSRGNMDLVMSLWERGASVNMETDRGTPLTAASRGGHVKVMRFVIDRGASVNTADGLFGRSPLHWACYFKKHQAVQCLLEHSADINSRLFGRTPLDIAVERGSKQCIHMLQNVIVDRKIKNNRGETGNTE